MAGEFYMAREDVFDAAMIFGGFQPTFSANDFTDFLKTQHVDAEAEDVDEILQSLAAEGKIRLIGPGVYARPVAQ